MDLKCDKDFENLDGGISSLILSGSSKARDVFVFPSRQLPARERENHTIKITARLNNLKSPNEEEKAKTLLSRMSPDCESEKVQVLDHKWLKNLEGAVENLPESIQETGFAKLS